MKGMQTVLICSSNNRHSALHPLGFPVKPTIPWVLHNCSLDQDVQVLPTLPLHQFKCGLTHSIGTGAHAHLGKYTSTFCFFTELAHSLIKEALTSGSSVTSGTSCLERTIIILISSPSYGISRT